MPALEVDSKLVAIDPLEPEFVEAILLDDKPRTEGFVPKNIDEAIARFKDSVAASSYASSVILVHGSLGPLLSHDFIEVVARLKLSRLSTNEVLRAIRVNSAAIYEDVRASALRVVALNYIRELVWLRRATSPKSRGY